MQLPRRPSDIQDITSSPRILTTVLLGIAVAALPAAQALAKGDHDGLPDRWEKRHHLNVRADDAARDADRDGLSNYGEYRSHTNPHRANSDRDHRGDGREDYDRDRLSNAQEIKTGNDPGDADSDDDGVKDGREHAGRIVKVGGGSVTIRLAAGGKLTALIGPDLECATGSNGPDREDEHEDAGEDAASDSAEGEAPDPGERDDADEPGADALASAASLDAGDDFDDEDPGEAAGDTELPVCASALKPGMVVHEAVVMLTGDGLVLVSIELIEEHGKRHGRSRRDG